MSFARAQSEIDRIVEMRLEGKTLHQIGQRFGFSRERARQILAEEGLTGVPWHGFQPIHYRRLARAVAKTASHIDRTAKPWEDGYPHGTLRGYRRGCTCDACRAANREYCYGRLGRTPTPRLNSRGTRSDGSHRVATYGRKP